MSFDLCFVPRSTDGRWDQVMDDLEMAAEEGRDFTGEEVDLWVRIVEAVTAIIDVDQFESDRCLQLDDGVGMQLTMSPGELSINSPYWFEGDDAERVVDKLRRVASVVEGVTGLVAYDPQADAAFLVDGSASAVKSFDHAAAVLKEQLGVQQPPPSTRPRRTFWRR